jgi:hypothetical protein
MCDGIKDMDFLQKQYDKAVVENIEIIEIEFASGQLRFRDRWSVGRILQEGIEKKKELEVRPATGAKI